MRIAELIADSARDLVPVGDTSDANVRSVALDSRRVEPGDIFVAVEGQDFNGHDYIQEAMRRGAAAVIGSDQSALNDLPVPAFHHPDPRAIVGTIASQLSGHPSKHLEMVGITGTNGKTTTLKILAAIEGARGRKTGTIGTLGATISGKPLPTALTTPEAPEVQSLLAEMRDDGCQSCIMEVSSHGIATGRVQGIDFRVTAFTNLTHDHLDFHSSMDSYGATKARLMMELQPGSVDSQGAVLNFDDAFAASLAPRMEAMALPYFGISTTGKEGVRGTTDALKLTGDGIEGELILDGQRMKFSSQLLGGHNLENILMAAAAAHLLGAPAEAIVAGIGAVGTVAGRLEPVSNPDSFLVLVDYAHTPDALSRILREVAELTEGRVICVFGCGGDRDRSKRAEMGAAAANGADVVVITSDNPRNEDPNRIIDDILEGVPAGAAENFVETNRATAIDIALSMANRTDTVLIAGKGHEDYQIIGGVKRAFSDHDVARLALDKLRTTNTQGDRS